MGRQPLWKSTGKSKVASRGGGSWATGDPLGKDGSSGGRHLEETWGVKGVKRPHTLNVSALATRMGFQLQSDSPGCGYPGTFAAALGMMLAPPLPSH